MSVADLVRYEMVVPGSLDEVCALLADRHERGQATAVLAGGTDWLVEREAGPVLAAEAITPMVVDVSRLAELRGIELEPARVGGAEVVRIGAAATYLELRRSALVQQRLPLLARMSRDVGRWQPDRGTLGGNWPPPRLRRGVRRGALAPLCGASVAKRTIDFADRRPNKNQACAASVVALRISVPAPTGMGVAQGWDARARPSQGGAAASPTGGRARAPRGMDGAVATVRAHAATSMLVPTPRWPSSAREWMTRWKTDVAPRRRALDAGISVTAALGYASWIRDRRASKFKGRQTAWPGPMVTATSRAARGALVETDHRIACRGEDGTAATIIGHGSVMRTARVAAGRGAMKRCAMNAKTLRPRAPE